MINTAWCNQQKSFKKQWPLSPKFKQITQEFCKSIWVIVFLLFLLCAYKIERSVNIHAPWRLKGQRTSSIHQQALDCSRDMVHVHHCIHFLFSPTRFCVWQGEHSWLNFTQNVNYTHSFKNGYASSSSFSTFLNAFSFIVDKNPSLETQDCLLQQGLQFV